MWVKSPSKTLSTFDEAVKNASSCKVGGYNDYSSIPAIDQRGFNMSDPDA